MGVFLLATVLLGIRPAAGLTWVFGITVVVTAGALVLVNGIRMTSRRRGAGSPVRAAAAPAPPATLLPSDRFRATDLLDIRDLHVGLPGVTGASEPGGGINLTVPRGQTLALIGDEGSGATQLCQAILGVLPRSSPVTSGSILFDGRELVTLPEREFRRLRGDRIGFLDSPAPRRLDPQVRIGRGLTTRLAGRPWAAGARARCWAVDLLRRLGVEAPAAVLACHPRQVTAASAQRALLTHALRANPQLVITLDPTRGLGPHAATAFLDLLHTLQRERGFTLLVVSARLDVVQRCDRVAIMRAGTIVEHASVQELLTEPNHRHSRRLLTGGIPGLTPADD